MRNFLETRQTTAGKNTGQCLTHVNKLACEIWSCFDNVQFSQKLNLRFLPSRLQIVYIDQERDTVILDGASSIIIES